MTRSVAAGGRRVTHVAVKVRTATFILPRWPTGPAWVFPRFETGRPIRLLGVRVMLAGP